MRPNCRLPPPASPSNPLPRVEGSRLLCLVRRLLMNGLTALFARRVSPVPEAVNEDVGDARHPQRVHTLNARVVDERV